MSDLSLTGRKQVLALPAHPRTLDSARVPHTVRSPRRRSLILDRTERTVYVAARADARRFLAQQWPKAEPGTLTQEEWTAMVKRLQNSRQDIDIDEINRRIEEQYALVEALQEWLDRHLPN